MLISIGSTLMMIMLILFNYEFDYVDFDDVDFDDVDQL